MYGKRTPGDRLSRLSQAGLRINESLDFDTALQAVMSSAQSLTDATDLERLWLASRQEAFFDVRTASFSPAGHPGPGLARDATGSDVLSVSGGIMPSVGNRSTQPVTRGPR